jgi:hypothetical protein
VTGDGARHAAGKRVAIVRFLLAAALAALAIAFVWRLSADRAEHAAEARWHAAAADRGLTGRIGAACGGRTGDSLARCAGEVVAQTREDRRQEYELQTQRDMADWAFWAMAVGALTMGLTAIGLYFVRETLREAVRGTEAAWRAVAVTEQSADAQLRAYLFPRNAKLEVREEGGWPVHIEIHNGGNTPARNVECRFGVWVRDLPLGRDLPLFCGDPVLYSVIGPNSFRTIGTLVGVSGEQATAIKERRACILARLWIAYSTHSGERIDEPVVDIFAGADDLEKGTFRVIPQRLFKPADQPPAAA